MAADVAQELDGILVADQITTAFQPVVDLYTGGIVAYEGLSRGPDGSALHMPADLFAAARKVRRLEELDWLCRLTALRRALGVGLSPPLTLFLNIEPEVLTPPPDDAGSVLARAIGGLRVIVELTERSLLARPATLLRFVEAVRHYGWGVAIDDVGAHPHSLAMLSVIEPDVVKLDQPELQKLPATDYAALISGVQTYCRRSGARIVAEGLETDDDIETARSVGAHYGQGWWFGRPAPLLAAPAVASTPIPMINPRPHLPPRRLIHLVTRAEPAQRGDRERIDRISTTLLEHSARMGPNTLVLAGVQNADFVSNETRSLLADLAKQVAYLGILGAGVDDEPVPRAHGVRLGVADPLVSEWVIVTIGLQEAIALVASDSGDSYEAGPNRHYEFSVTYDPQLVTDIARALLTRVD